MFGLVLPPTRPERFSAFLQVLPLLLPSITLSVSVPVGPSLHSSRLMSAVGRRDQYPKTNMHGHYTHAEKEEKKEGEENGHTRKKNHVNCNHSGRFKEG